MPDNIANLTGVAPETQPDGLKAPEIQTVTPDSGETAELFLGILETHLPTEALPEEAVAPVTALASTPTPLPQGGNPLPVQPLPAQPEQAPELAEEVLATETKRTETAGRPAALALPTASAGKGAARAAAVETAVARPIADNTTAEAVARPADTAVQGHSAPAERTPGAEPPLRSEIPARVDSPRWGDALANRVAWSVRGGNQSAELRLNPPELGPIEVKIALSNNEASISFGAQHAAVREAIELALPRLREMLGQNGVTLGDVNVSSHSQGESGQAGTQEGSRSEGYEESDGDAAGVATASDAPGSSGEGLVDHYA